MVKIVLSLRCGFCCCKVSCFFVKCNKKRDKKIGLFNQKGRNIVFDINQRWINIYYGIFVHLHPLKTGMLQAFIYTCTVCHCLQQTVHIRHFVSSRTRPISIGLPMAFIAVSFRLVFT